jgi:hypothetical protein
MVNKLTMPPTVVPTIAWAKLAALVEGARIASQKLWAGTG